MLEKLGEVLKKATDKIANAIFLDKNLVDTIVRDLQRALIEADVNIILVKQLSDKIKKAALDERIKECINLGYKNIYAPAMPTKIKDANIRVVKNIQELQ